MMTTEAKNLTRRLAPLALFLLLCYHELYRTTTPILRSMQQQNTNSPPPIYWGMSCPLEAPSFSISSRDLGNWLQDPTYLSSPAAETYDSFTQRARTARDYSLSSYTPQRVINALNSRAFISRKIVFVGDSLTRQNYISLGCLASSSHQISRHVTPFFPNRKEGGLFYDGRMEWSIGGEVFYAPTAGKMFTYNWGEAPDGPIVGGEESWLDSCRQNQPFEFDTYSYDINSDGSRDLIRVRLSNQDVVFLNAGFHFFRKKNHENLLKLVACMEQKGRKNFPSLVYVTSSVQHFDVEHHGVVNANGERMKKCTNVVENNARMEEEVELYRRKLPIMGEDVELLDKGDLHVIGEKTDCTHWFQPGIPDVYAAKAAEVVVKIAEGVDLMMLMQGGGDDGEMGLPPPEEKVEMPVTME